MPWPDKAPAFRVAVESFQDKMKKVQKSTLAVTRARSIQPVEEYNAEDCYLVAEWRGECEGTQERLWFENTNLHFYLESDLATEPAAKRVTIRQAVVWFGERTALCPMYGQLEHGDVGLAYLFFYAGIAMKQAEG